MGHKMRNWKQKEYTVKQESFKGKLHSKIISSDMIEFFP